MDSETKGVVETYGSSDGKRLEEFIHLFSSHIPALMREEQLQGDRFYYHNLKHRGIQSLPQGAMSAGAVVVASIDTRLLGLLFLEYDELRKKADRDEVRLLGRAVAILVQNIKALRQREQKEDLEIRLEHSQRLEAVGTLAGGIAHEFNNALGAILGYGEMALQVSRNSARTRQYVREIVSSGERAKRIVDQILTFSRKRERIAKPFDVKEALEDIMPLVGLAVPGGEISMHIADGLPAVSGNPIELQQVIMNLCTNSAQAMGETGQIEIDVREVDIGVKQVLSHGLLPRGKYVHISVQDHGSGIAPSVLPHIFEPFFTTRAKSGGTGLGLSAVHGLVTAMKGNINVYSDANNGTRFDIYLPSTCQPPVPLRQFFNEQIIPLGDGQMVVIGQRDTGLRLMFEEKIAALGYEPIGFSSISALEGWLDENERPPELVLLDVDLWTSAPELKEINRQFGSIQTLIMADADHVEDHKSEERTSFLRKPVSSNSLAAGIFKAIVRP
jgi:signal transduction histidine kinase